MPTHTDWNWTRLRSICEREAARIVYNRADRDDAVQEALARAWTHRAACRTPLAPDAWVRQIARREAVRFAVRQRSDRERRTECAVELPHADAAEAVADRLDVQGLLRMLAPHERRLLMLRYHGDMSYGEVADALQVPVGTVKVWLHRLHKRVAPLAAAQLRGEAATTCTR
ncbi:MAG TPA: RNA polymerase sigma factor [Solirubrobacteraceae bacterium]|nr:RNA polymerase sigma factor [Solirubrobacteraceae bacterium]